MSLELQKGNNTVLFIRREKYENNRSGKFVEECFIEFKGLENVLSCENIVTACLSTGDHLVHYKSTTMKNCDVKIDLEQQKLTGFLKVSFSRAEFDRFDVDVYSFTVEDFSKGVYAKK